MSKSGSKTLAATANLANLLPTGTVLAFEVLAPLFSNDGSCEFTNRFLTLSMIVCCSVACFLSSFTDSFIGKDQKLHHSIATFKGVFVLSDHEGFRHGQDEEQLEKFRLTWIDFVHAFGSLMVFLVFALSSNDVQHCFFPIAELSQKKLFKNLQLGVTFFVTFVFTRFPSKRRGIGYGRSDRHRADFNCNNFSSSIRTRSRQWQLCRDRGEKFSIGKNEILSLLKSLLVSNAPLTETLLKNSELERPNQECFAGTTLKKRSPFSGQFFGNIYVKLIVRKSNERVVYAEANEDFIDLLFSFLTVPLGHVAKSMEDGSSKGCARNLYRSVYRPVNVVSRGAKQCQLSPAVPWHFGTGKQLLGFTEKTWEDSVGGGNGSRRRFIYMDPKSRDYETEISSSSSSGYVKGNTMFTVTDDLVIKPISPLSGLSFLRESKIPFSDVEERIVRVCKDEATRLLVASLISESPLTDVFVSHVPNQERKDSAFCFDFIDIFLKKILNQYKEK